MKKLTSLVLVVVMLASLFSFNVFADSSIKVAIDGVNQTYDVMPVIDNGRTLVPMRAIFEALGASVSWDDATKTVTGTKDETVVVLQIGNKEVYVNNDKKELDVPAKIVDGRTLVPVRFISESLGCNVGWDDSTKTVIINTTSSSSKGLAKLISEVHRKVPTEFTKSNDLNDIVYFDGASVESQEAIYAEVKKDGEVVCTEEEFISQMKPVQGPDFGNFEVVDVEGMPFKKALRMTCTAVPEKDSGLIANTAATPERNPGDGVSKSDQMLLAFRIRLVDGGNADGQGQIKVQVQHPTSYAKALFSIALADKDWKIVYMPFTGVEDATGIGIRFGYSLQTVEVGGIEIINFGPGYDVNKLPSTTEKFAELEKDAQWRKDANDRIEKIRKGDFKVVVKDKDGNVIPDAQVELDMFEHEFQFGNAVNPSVYTNEEYAKHHNSLFNAGVVEHSMKWGPYERDAKAAHDQVNGAFAAGVKYMRGHALFWEKSVGSDGKTYLTPEYMFEDEVLKNREVFDEKCRQHVAEICTAFKGQMVDWDVANEIVDNKKLRADFGSEVFKQWYAWAREYAGPDCQLYINETTPVWDKAFMDYLDEFQAMGVDYDGIGIQSHYDGNLKMPSQLMALYDSFKKYGKRLKITEYSCSIADKALQGNYTRDVIISCFADELMDGFLMWGFWDGHNYKAYSPIYDSDWNLKPAGEAYVDLVYNKWWTKDAKANTGADGSATIRGFYGDYDVTVTANGKTTTKMVAFHKGYDNVLEITVE